MKNLSCLIIYPIDSGGEKYGGIETTIRSYVKSFPPAVKIEIIGISAKNDHLRPGRWYDLTFSGRPVRFFPVIEVNDPNARTRIPLVFKFSLALAYYRRKIDFSKRVLMFHRLEPAYLLGGVASPKVLFLHGNIPQYLKDKYSENRWKGLHKIYFFLEPFFLKRMARIFVVSQVGCAYYQKKYSHFARKFTFLPT